MTQRLKRGARLGSLLGLLLALLAGANARADEVPMRLPDTVRPLAVRLSLTVDPDRPTHEGEVAIDLRLAAASSRIRLHARELVVSEAAATVAGRRIPAQVRQVDAERIDLQFARPLPAGRATLRLAFRGQVSDKNVYGLFRQQDDGRWYAFTQFEATGARRAFPAFDEPGFKIPWRLSLTVPASAMAVANMPVLRERPARPGWKRVDFAPSPPMPSYLLAFGVGPFDVLDGGRAGASGVALRYITPRGRAQEARYAAQVTGRILERLEAYFGMPYPYAKLDSLVLPVTVNFGAMENPGLVTYASNLMLARPEEQTGRFERGYTSVAAHELSHMWFGNLVTMAWWDDLWLNESFASWMGDRITDELMPAWGWADNLQRERAWAMRNDQLLSARRMQQPVTRDDEMGGIFDGIAYAKGQTVLTMFERWLGPQRFREGVRRYMQRHAWGSATGSDFFGALAGDDPGLADALRSFTAQAGIPRLQAELVCDASGARLAITQQRLLPLGSAAGDAERAQRWQVPVVLRTPAGSARAMVPAEGASVRLPDASCPAWVEANVGGQGYYRVAYGPGTPSALRAAPQPLVGEILAGLDDAAGLARAGDVPAGELLPLIQRFASHPNQKVADQVLWLLDSLQPLLESAQRPAFAALLQQAFGLRARTLGWMVRPGEDDEDRLLRPRLLGTLADLGEDAALRRSAAGLARAWLKDPGSLDASVRRAVLQAAALEGDAALFDAYLAAALATPQRNVRHDLFAGLGSFRDPALARRARELLLDPRIDLREAMWPMLQPQNQDPTLRDGLIDFFASRHAALVARMDSESPASLPEEVDRACSAGEARRIEAAFAPHAARFAGGARALAQTLEGVQLCEAYRQRQSASLAEALSRLAK